MLLLTIGRVLSIIDSTAIGTGESSCFTLSALDDQRDIRRVYWVYRALEFLVEWLACLFGRAWLLRCLSFIIMNHWSSSYLTVYHCLFAVLWKIPVLLSNALVGELGFTILLCSLSPATVMCLTMLDFTQM